MKMLGNLLKKLSGLVRCSGYCVGLVISGSQVWLPAVHTLG